MISPVLKFNSSICEGVALYTGSSWVVEYISYRDQSIYFKEVLLRNDVKSKGRCIIMNISNSIIRIVVLLSETMEVCDMSINDSDNIESTTDFINVSSPPLEDDFFIKSFASFPISSKVILSSSRELFYIDFDEEKTSKDIHFHKVILQTESGKDFKIISNNNFLIKDIKITEQSVWLLCQDTYTGLFLLRCCILSHTNESLKVLWEVSIPDPLAIIVSDHNYAQNYIFVISGNSLTVLDTSGIIIDFNITTNSNQTNKQTHPTSGCLVPILSKSTNSSMFSILISYFNGEYVLFTFSLSSHSASSSPTIRSSRVTLQPLRSHFNSSVASHPPTPVLPYCDQMLALHHQIFNCVYIFGCHRAFGRESYRMVVIDSDEVDVDVEDPNNRLLSNRLYEMALTFDAVTDAHAVAVISESADRRAAPESLVIAASICHSQKDKTGNRDRSLGLTGVAVGAYSEDEEAGMLYKATVGVCLRAIDRLEIDLSLLPGQTTNMNTLRLVHATKDITPTTHSIVTTRELGGETTISLLLTDSTASALRIFTGSDVVEARSIFPWTDVVPLLSGISPSEPHRSLKSQFVAWIRVSPTHFLLALSQSLSMWESQGVDQDEKLTLCGSAANIRALGIPAAIDRNSTIRHAVLASLSSPGNHRAQFILLQLDTVVVVIRFTNPLLVSVTSTSKTKAKPPVNSNNRNMFQYECMITANQQISCIAALSVPTTISTHSTNSRGSATHSVLYQQMVLAVSFWDEEEIFLYGLSYEATGQLTSEKILGLKPQLLSNINTKDKIGNATLRNLLIFEMPESVPVVADLDVTDNHSIASHDFGFRFGVVGSSLDGLVLIYYVQSALLGIPQQHRSISLPQNTENRVFYREEIRLKTNIEMVQIIPTTQDFTFQPIPRSEDPAKTSQSLVSILLLSSTSEQYILSLVKSFLNAHSPSERSQTTTADTEAPPVLGARGDYIEPPTFEWIVVLISSSDGDEGCKSHHISRSHFKIFPEYSSLLSMSPSPRNPNNNLLLTCWLEKRYNANQPRSYGNMNENGNNDTVFFCSGYLSDRVMTSIQCSRRFAGSISELISIANISHGLSLVAVYISTGANPSELYLLDTRDLSTLWERRFYGLIACSIGPYLPENICRKMNSIGLLTLCIRDDITTSSSVVSGGGSNRSTGEDLSLVVINLVERNNGMLADTALGYLTVEADIQKIESKDDGDFSLDMPRFMPTLHPLSLDASHDSVVVVWRGKIRIVRWTSTPDLGNAHKKAEIRHRIYESANSISRYAEGLESIRDIDEDLSFVHHGGSNVHLQSKKVSLSWYLRGIEVLSISSERTSMNLTQIHSITDDALTKSLTTTTTVIEIPGLSSCLYATITPTQQLYGHRDGSHPIDPKFVFVVSQKDSLKILSKDRTGSTQPMELKSELNNEIVSIQRVTANKDAGPSELSLRLISNMCDAFIMRIDVNKTL